MFRNETKLLSLHKFKSYIDQIETTEYKIAEKNNKIIEEYGFVIIIPIKRSKTIIII